MRIESIIRGGAFFDISKNLISSLSHGIAAKYPQGYTSLAMASLTEAL